MKPTRILICDRDQDTVKHLAEALRDAGHDVIAVDRTARAQALLSNWKPSLLMLDVQLGETGGDGWSFLAQARKRSEGLAIIVVTGLHRVDDRIRALKLGADDCVAKPFHPGELVARIEAVMRRGRAVAIPETKRIVIDDERKEVRTRDRTVTLSPKEYALLKLLHSSPGKVFSSDEILRTLWGRQSYATRQDVQKYVYLLRKKLEEDPKRPEFVITIRGFGYRLSA